MKHLLLKAILKRFYALLSQILSVIPILPYLTYQVTYISLYAENSKLLSVSQVHEIIKMPQTKTLRGIFKQGSLSIAVKRVA